MGKTSIRGKITEVADVIKRMKNSLCLQNFLFIRHQRFKEKEKCDQSLVPAWQQSGGGTSFPLWKRWLHHLQYSKQIIATWLPIEQGLQKVKMGQVRMTQLTQLPACTEPCLADPPGPILFPRKHSVCTVVSGKESTNFSSFFLVCFLPLTQELREGELGSRFLLEFQVIRWKVVNNSVLTPFQNKTWLLAW